MGRPSRPILSPERIADAALALVDRTGDLQMVQLAVDLGVAPSSLYNHVRGRGEVIDLARLRMLEPMEQQPAAESWQETVAQLLRRLADRYAQHPRMLSLMFASSVSNERTIALYEPTFRALLDAGFPADQLRLIAAIIDFQALGLAYGFPAPVMTDSIRERLPAYTASIDHSRYSRATATELSVATVVRGLEATLVEQGATVG